MYIYKHVTKSISTNDRAPFIWAAYSQFRYLEGREKTRYPFFGGQRKFAGFDFFSDSMLFSMTLHNLWGFSFIYRWKWRGKNVESGLKSEPQTFLCVQNTCFSGFSHLPERYIETFLSRCGVFTEKMEGKMKIKKAKILCCQWPWRNWRC